MPNAADIGARVKELEELVGAGEFDYFFDRALDFAGDFGNSTDRREALTRKGNYSLLKVRIRRREITREEYGADCNSLIMEALEHKDTIQETVLVRSSSSVQWSPGIAPPPAAPPAGAS